MWLRSDRQTHRPDAGHIIQRRGPGRWRGEIAHAPPADPRRLALAALVRCVEDERCSASFPHAFPTVLRVTTRTGARTLAVPEAQRVEDLTALLTSAGER
jgi:hypothetical protein